MAPLSTTPRRSAVDVDIDHPVSRLAWTRALVHAMVVVALAVSAPLACTDNATPTDPVGPPLPFAISFVDVDGDETHVKPNESRQVVFALRDAGGQALPDRTVQLLITDAVKARGATLSTTRALTDNAGQVMVQIIGGQPTAFTVRASAQGAPDRDLKVNVTAQDSGPVAISPQASGFVAVNLAKVRVAVFENMGCAAIARGVALGPAVPTRDTVPGKVVVFGSVPAVGGHAILGQGLDQAGTLLVEGCVDLSGQSILAETTIHVLLPLLPTEPSAVGQFAFLSQLRFAPEPALEPPPLRNLRGAWRELNACDLDPGRLWLDCTVDALAPAPGAPADPMDPLDCKPSAADEAVFDGRLSARRGLPIPSLKDGRCRQDFDGAGHASLEKQIAAMFVDSPTVVADLKAIAAEADKLLETFRVRSTVQVVATSQPGRLQLDHRLTQLEVGVGAEAITINLPDLGAPSPGARFIAANATRTDITIARHGFTLRLGSAARVAFLQGALTRRKYPTAPTQFIAGVFAKASYFDRNVTYKGCAALAALVCPLVGGQDGCLLMACDLGVAALGQALNNSFAQMDGNDLDFFLEGSAPLRDDDGDGRVDGIGWLLNSPGVWNALIRINQEQFPLTGFFAADRVIVPSPAPP